jgi:hypothetical protein
MYIDDSQIIQHSGGYTVIKENKHEQANLDDNTILLNKYGKSWHELI